MLWVLIAGELEWLEALISRSGSDMPATVPTLVFCAGVGVTCSDIEVCDGGRQGTRRCWLRATTGHLTDYLTVYCMGAAVLHGWRALPASAASARQPVTVWCLPMTGPPASISDPQQAQPPHRADWLHSEHRGTFQTAAAETAVAPAGEGFPMLQHRSDNDSTGH